MSITVSSVSAFAACVGTARSVNLAAYTLHGGRVRNALVAAAAAGATVRVRLERDPLDTPDGALHAANAGSLAVLLAAGADAALTPIGQPVVHMKAAVVDGVAWLDDRNWNGDARETVLRDTDPADVAALSEALAGGRGASDRLRTTKSEAQALELDMIEVAGTAPVAIATESLGNGAVYDALLRRGQAALPTRLLVAGREAEAPGAAGETERRRLSALQAAGIEIRAGDPAADTDEKLALGAGMAWAGSANASYAGGLAGEQRDWGLVTGAADVVAALRSAFEADWNTALPFAGAAREQ